jgi:hypothetical protein
MIKCLIVGGMSAKSIADYIRKTSGGSIEILEEDVYHSFSTDIDTLKKSMIRADKLIYKIDESVSIRDDLTSLYELMNNKAFFDVREIYVFGEDNENNIKGSNYFKQLMIELDFHDYRINLVEGETSYQDIYREITGIVDTEKKKVSYKRVYRSVISEDSITGYDPQNYKKNILPKEEDRLEAYEKMKSASVISDNNRPIIDIPSKELPELDVDFKGIEIDPLTYEKNIIIVCGNPKAGTSVFASNLARSLYSNNKIDMIDISPNCGSARHCLRIIKNSKLVDNKELLTGKVYTDIKFCIFSTAEIKDTNLKVSYLKYYLSIPNRTKSDYIIIDCTIDQLDKVLDVCEYRLSRIFYCTQSVRDELLLIENKVNSSISKKIDTFIFLNNSIKFDKTFKVITAVDADKICKGAKVIEPVDLSERKDLSTLLQV